MFSLIYSDKINRHYLNRIGHEINELPDIIIFISFHFHIVGRPIAEQTIFQGGLERDRGCAPCNKGPRSQCRAGAFALWACQWSYKEKQSSGHSERPLLYLVRGV